MGAKCCSSNKDCKLPEVNRQDLLMENDEVKVVRVHNKTMVNAKKNQKNTELFDGYLQRKSYFVIPQLDKLKQEKIELKNQMIEKKTTRQQYPKMRVKAAGEDLTKKQCLYYVSVV